MIVCHELSTSATRSRQRTMPASCVSMSGAVHLIATLFGSSSSVSIVSKLMLMPVYQLL